MRSPRACRAAAETVELAALAEDLRRSFASLAALRVELDVPGRILDDDGNLLSWTSAEAEAPQGGRSRSPDEPLESRPL